MQIRPSRESADIVVLVPEGRLDAQAAPELDRELSKLELQGYTRVILDCSHASYVSSSSLRVLLIHTSKQRNAGGDLKMCCLTDKVADVLQITGLHAVFGVFASEDEAARAFLDPSAAPMHS